MHSNAFHTLLFLCVLAAPALPHRTPRLHCHPHCCCCCSGFQFHNPSFAFVSEQLFCTPHKPALKNPPVWFNLEGAKTKSCRLPCACISGLPINARCWSVFMTQCRRKKIALHLMLGLMVKIIGTGEITRSFFPSTIIMLRSLLFDLPYYLWKCVSYIHFEFNSDKEHDISLKLRAGNEFSRFLFKMMLTCLGTRISIKHSWEISLWKICYILASQTEKTEGLSIVLTILGVWNICLAFI